MPQTPPTRWCPTPEQLMILEDMYRNGVRTPNSSQIRHITAHLSIYGRIEGKNVFYWFQNHKARDRQKLRRRLSRQHYHLLHGCNSQFPSFQDASSLLPITQLYQYPQTEPINLLHQGEPQEKAQGMNLLCKLETNDAWPATNNICGYEWTTRATDSNSNTNPILRPLETLDLFPTKSTGFRDECSSTSTF